MDFSGLIKNYKKDHPKKQQEVVVEEEKTGNEEYMYMLIENDGKIKMCGIFPTLKKAQESYEECLDSDEKLEWIEDDWVSDAWTAKGYEHADETETRMYIVKMLIGEVSSGYLDLDW